MKTIPYLYLGAGALVLGVLAYVAMRGAAQTGQQIGGAAVDMVDGVITGGTIKAGELIGIPATNETECEKAIREGRTWDASFACPAKRFLSHVFS